MWSNLRKLILPKLRIHSRKKTTRQQPCCLHRQAEASRLSVCGNTVAAACRLNLHEFELSHSFVSSLMDDKCGNALNIYLTEKLKNVSENVRIIYIRADGQSWSKRVGWCLILSRRARRGRSSARGWSSCISTTLTPSKTWRTSLGACAVDLVLFSERFERLV